MSKMVERVALAIGRVIAGGEVAPVKNWEKAARAAIEAMRVPTEAMTVEGGIYAVVHDAAQDTLVRKTWSDMNSLAQLDFMASVDRSWRAMINTALK